MSAEPAERMCPPTLDPDESVMVPGIAQAIRKAALAVAEMAAGPVSIGEANAAAWVLEKVAIELRRAASLAEYARAARWKRQAGRP